MRKKEGSNFSIFASLVLTFILVVSVFSFGDVGLVSAQDSEVTEGNVDLEDIDPGNDGFFGRLGEGMQLAFTGDASKEAALREEFIDRRYARMRIAFEQGDYNAMRRAAQEAGDLYDDLANDIREYESDGATADNLRGEGSQFGEFNDMHSNCIFDYNYLGPVMDEVDLRVETGEITQEEADAIREGVEGGLKDLVFSIGEKKDEFIGSIEKNSGITEIEAEILLEVEEKRVGDLEKIYASQLTSEELSRFEENLNEEIVYINSEAVRYREEGNHEAVGLMESYREYVEWEVQESYSELGLRDYDSAKRKRSNREGKL
jgi:hypothetical protein